MSLGCCAEQFRSSADTSPLLHESGNLLDLTMLDVVKDPITPAVPAERASSPETREEEPTGLPTPSESPTSQSEVAAHSGELVLMWRRLPPAPPVFTGSWADESNLPPRGQP